MKLPKLYHKAKGGDLREWEVWTVDDIIYTRYGQVGGKLQVSEKRATPKNVGRANETSPAEQARLEAESMWRFKVERKYSETPEAAREELRLPMLAHKYEDKKKLVTFPAWIQPKLDGVRCLAEWDGNSISLTSRSGKPYNMPTVQEQLAKWLPRDWVLDGELYYHGMSCQSITSFVKKWKPGSEKIVYNVYDVPVAMGDEDLTAINRLALLLTINESENVQHVPSYNVASHSQMIERYGEFIEDGYEGAILRLPEGKYLWGYRSSELLKVKEFQDAEFKVIGAKEGRGKMKGCVIWTCKNDITEDIFDCSMKTTMEERKSMYDNRFQYSGRLLTVRFFDRSDDGIPRFPVGIVFREKEDL